MGLLVLWLGSSCADPAKLERSILKGKLASVTRLLERHPEWIASTNQYGATPLHLAAASGRLEIVELLLAYGADIQAQTSDGYTPLHTAAWRGRVAVVGCLLNHGALIDAVNLKQDTPLHEAAANGNLETVKVLLAHQAAVDPRDSDSQTPLHHAAADCDQEISRILLEAGADANALDKLRRNPLHTVAASSCETVIQALVAEREVSDVAEMRSQVKMVELLLEHGTQINVRDAYGLTPLALAEFKKNAPLVEKLRREGGTT